MSFLQSLVFVIPVIAVLGVFLWFWWAAPRDQVPPHATADQLRRLEVQDRLRQTNYQVLTAVGLGVTFLVSIFQLSMTSRQWSSDYELRTKQDRAALFHEALKSLASKDNHAAKFVGATTLANLATVDPEGYSAPVHEALAAFLQQRAEDNEVKESQECYGEEHPHRQAKWALRWRREDAPIEVRAAMSALGNHRVAVTREHTKKGFNPYSEEVCRPSPHGVSKLRLDHTNLNNLDLQKKNFSCVDFSQAHLHRVIFIEADLRGADFGGAQIGDFEISFSPAALGTVKDRLYVLDGYADSQTPPGTSDDQKRHDEKRGIQPWERHRCWVTDFRGARLEGANFRGASLAGADFRGAVFDKKTNWCYANVSRANFRGAVDLDPRQFQNACVGNDKMSKAELDEAQPLHNLGSLKFNVCGTDYLCRM